MRLISFEKFKNHCVHMDEDFEFDVHCCDYKDKGDEMVTYKAITYYPCREKDCPVLSICKKIKKGRLL